VPVPGVGEGSGDSRGDGSGEGQCTRALPEDVPGDSLGDGSADLMGTGVGDSEPQGEIDPLGLPPRVITTCVSPGMPLAAVPTIVATARPSTKPRIIFTSLTSAAASLNLDPLETETRSLAPPGQD
jgi:hypothetical protein